MGILKSMNTAWDQITGQNKTVEGPAIGGGGFTTQRSNKRLTTSLLSDPSVTIDKGIVRGNDGSGIVVDQNAVNNSANILEADRQRAELQKKVGTKGSSILGGGLY